MKDLLIDSSLWIDFTRARSPQSLKSFVAPYIFAANASLSEPIAFEVLRHASDDEIGFLNSLFETIPFLPTPQDLWAQATELGRSCRKKGVNAGGIDLLICATAIHHGAEVVTFDEDFRAIGRVSGLRARILRRPQSETFP